MAKEFTQHDYETYVALRDEMNWLDQFYTNVEKEYYDCEQKLNTFLDEFEFDADDKEGLDIRYNDGLLRYKPKPHSDCDMCINGWTKYGPCGCRSQD